MTKEELLWATFVYNEGVRQGYHANWNVGANLFERCATVDGDTYVVWFSLKDGKPTITEVVELANDYGGMRYYSALSEEACRGCLSAYVSAEKMQLMLFQLELEQ